MVRNYVCCWRNLRKIEAKIIKLRPLKIHQRRKAPIRSKAGSERKPFHLVPSNYFLHHSAAVWLFFASSFHFIFFSFVPSIFFAYSQRQCFPKWLSVPIANYCIQGIPFGKKVHTHTHIHTRTAEALVSTMTSHRVTCCVPCGIY